MPIVVGVDESESAIHVLRKAIEEARLRGETMHVVHVFHPPVMYLASTLVDPQRLEIEHRARVWEGLDSDIEAADVGIERVNLSGYPPDVLCDYITEVSAPLVVVGTRGRGELSSLLLGSTSHRVAQAATCDVLIIKP